MKLLSISIASYNAATTLKKCLDTMTSSNNLDALEIIVVNDGSNDTTLDIAEEYAKKYPQSIIVVNKKNGGHGSTINCGIDIANGKYFKTVDADDWVETLNLDKLIDALRNNNADLFINPYYVVDAKNGKKTLVSVVNETFEFNKIYQLEKCISGVNLAMHSMTIKSSILKSMELSIDEKCFYVDMEYILFPLPLIKDVIFLEYPLYNYLLGTATQSMNLDVFIARRTQHEKVLYRLFNFYRQVSHMDNHCSAAIKKRIVSAVYIQYRILFMLSPKEIKSEYIKFDKHVPEEIFVDISGNTKKLIYLFRLTKYHFFVPLLNILHFLKLIKKEPNIL